MTTVTPARPNMLSHVQSHGEDEGPRVATSRSLVVSSIRPPNVRRRTLSATAGALHRRVGRFISSVSLRRACEDNVSRAKTKSLSISSDESEIDSLTFQNTQKTTASPSEESSSSGMKASSQPLHLGTLKAACMSSPELGRQDKVIRDEFDDHLERDASPDRATISRQHYIQEEKCQIQFPSFASAMKAIHSPIAVSKNTGKDFKSDTANVKATNETQLERREVPFPGTQDDGVSTKEGESSASSEEPCPCQNSTLAIHDRKGRLRDSDGTRPGPSVTFMDAFPNVKVSSVERLPYKDWKMAGSVTSLTGVLEEDEHSSPSNDSNTAHGAVKDNEHTQMDAVVSTPIDKGKGREQEKADCTTSSSQYSPDTRQFPFPSRVVPLRRQSARMASPIDVDEFTHGGLQRRQRHSNVPFVPFPKSKQSAARHNSNAKQQDGGDRHVEESRDELQGKHIRFPTDMQSRRPVLFTRQTDDGVVGRASPRQRHMSELGGQNSEKLKYLRNKEGQRLESSSSTSKEKLKLSESGRPDIVFQLGNCIGRGQFGSVYRALNLTSGQMVAVKRIEVEGRSEQEVTQLMHEVELLKSLTHRSVVKYEGFIRDEENVSIILEYVENGSLLNTLKAFGDFPEKLVASYVAKILDGLVYLHDMKVVHCDLKAANILTTKNGNIKLSDFGVSLNLKAAQDLKSNDAIGTPYWMAPEVIELKGASTAADIWSLGCTIIEMLTRKPPYSNMNAMSAMFRIVEDECPPLPEEVSDTMTDFLQQCFKKDPTSRPSASMLLDHDWLRVTWDAHKGLRSKDSEPFLHRLKALHSLENSREGVSEAYKNNFAPIEESRSKATASEPASTRAKSPDISQRRASRQYESLLHSPKRHLSHLSASPASTPSVEAFARSSSEIPSTNPSFDILRSPSLMATFDNDPSSGVAFFNGSPNEADISGLVLMDEAKAHSFVKSSFNKTVTCKICREQLKKNAELCQQCGLICHAGCAKNISTPCNLRGQIMMLADTTRRGSNGMSGALDVALETGVQDARPGSPRSTISARLSRLNRPIAKFKRNTTKSLGKRAKLGSGQYVNENGKFLTISVPPDRSQSRIHPDQANEVTLDPRDAATSPQTPKNKPNTTPTRELSRSPATPTAMQRQSSGSAASMHSLIDHGEEARDEDCAMSNDSRCLAQPQRAPAQRPRRISLGNLSHHSRAIKSSFSKPKHLSYDCKAFSTGTPDQWTSRLDGTRQLSPTDSTRPESAAGDHVEPHDNTAEPVASVSRQRNRVSQTQTDCVIA